MKGRLTNDVFPAGLRSQGYGLKPKAESAPVSRTQHFFHGTSSHIEDTHLRPSAQTDKENYDYDAFSDADKRRSSVFMTTHHDPKIAESKAWDWAGRGTYNKIGDGRRSVKVVKPEGKVEPDINIRTAVMAPSAMILRPIDIPPAGYSQYPRDL